MNQQEFKQIFEKLTDRRREVLEQVMLGQTDAAIANAMGITETTVRKHIERICQEFGLDNHNQEGRRYKRSDLVALFARYKPELLSDRTFGSPKEAMGGEIGKTTPLPVLQLEQTPDELKKTLFQLFLAREDAAEWLEEELQIRSDQPERIQRAKNLNQMGYDFYLEGNFKKASFYLERAIKLNPDMGAAHYNLGLTSESLQDLSKASNHYKIAMQQSDIAADAATNNLARLEIRQRNFQHAVELIHPVLLRAEDPIVKASLYKNLGWAYYELTSYSAAKDNLLNSLKLKPDYAPAYYLLGKVQELTGDPESALASFKEFLKYDSNHPKFTEKTWRLPELDDWHFAAAKYVDSH